MKTIGSLFRAKDGFGPSFDMIRLFAALLVMVSHSFHLTKGGYGIWLPLTARQFSPGGLAVAIFFVLSGFVITESFQRDPRPGTFLRKRALRIYPALVITVLITALIAGPLLTALPLPQYFANRGLLAYLFNAIMPVSANLPGVFTDNLVPGVNGSIWTLRVEILCYLTVALLGSYFFARRWLVLGLAVLLTLATGTAVVLIMAGRYHPSLLDSLLMIVAPLLTNFAAGAAFALYADKIPVNANLVFGAGLLLLASSVFGGFYYVFPVAGAYLIILLGSTDLLRFDGLRRGLLAGDFSYGVYIIAFPVQQSVIHFAGNRCAWWLDLLISVPVSLALAIVSWHLIEKPFLKLKYRDGGTSLVWPTESRNVV